MTFFAELRRRHVIRVAIAYAVVAWLLVQVASILVPALRLPEWAMSFVILLLILGFPVALFLAWAYELTPDGVRKAEAGPAARPRRRVAGRRLDFAIIGVLTAALAFFVFERFLLQERQPLPPSGGIAEPAVAVLPFVSLSGDEEQGYFAEGISEELINALSQIAGLRVPSRTSSFSFAGTDTQLSDIAAQLDVTHLLEGSVRREAGQVRVRAQLIDASSNETLWGETFTRQLTGVFEIQDEIAMRVAEALQLTLLGTPGQGLSRTQNSAAHDAYLRGLADVSSFSSADVLSAIESFRQAIELDPQFAAAYAMLAHSYNVANQFDFLDGDEASTAARAAVERALELDPLLARAWYERSQLAEDLSQRLADLQRATELGLNDSQAWLSRANALTLLDRRAEARRALEEASRLDPRSAVVNWRMGAMRLNLGDRSGARGYYSRQLEVDPANPTGYAGLGDVAMFEGRIDEAVRWYVEGLRHDPRQGHMTVWTGFLYLTLGDHRRAQLWLDRGASILRGRGTAEEFFSEFVALAVRHEDDERLLELVNGVTPEFFGPFATRMFRKAVIATDRRAMIRAWYERIWPALFETDPVINNFNFDIAPDIAWILRGEGRIEQADALVDAALAVYRAHDWAAMVPWEPAMFLVEVDCLVQQGELATAIEVLRRATDDGWRFGHWQLSHDPMLEPIKALPEFGAILSEIEDEMAAQLANMPVWDLPSDPP